MDSRPSAGYLWHLPGGVTAGGGRAWSPQPPPKATAAPWGLGRGCPGPRDWPEGWLGGGARELSCLSLEEWMEISQPFSRALVSSLPAIWVSDTPFDVSPPLLEDRWAAKHGNK